MTEYEAVIRTAECEAEKGQYKEAYNTLGQVLEYGGPQDRDCRYRRGKYALQVSHMRLDHIEDAPDSRMLIKAACWLARSEAYLTSATEGASDAERRAIEDDLARTKEEQQRFRRLCKEIGLDLFS